MADEEKFKAPEQKTAEEKPVESQKKEEAARAHEPKAEKTASKKESPAKEEKKREIVLKRIATFSLATACKKPLQTRSNYAARLTRAEVARAFKVELKKVKLDPKVSEALFVRGGCRPPKKIKLSCSKDKEGIVLAEIA
ncbi:MAG: hypothetical protein WC607_03985 [Candidatus Micrarchaeia archaeon]